jgi:hypothetical protein
VADELKILDEILGLSSHYPARKLAPKEHARWLQDYVGDLTRAGFEHFHVQVACANWRTSEAKKMPTPGELLSYCRKVFTPEQEAAIKPLPKPERPQYSDEHKAEMRARIAGLIGELAARQKDYRRRNETEAEYAERQWPGRRIDRVRARAPF